jgi:C1A family cysteine protease
MVKHYYGAIRNDKDIRDFHIRSYFAMEAIPPAFNFVDKMPPVRNQGQVGSCVAFASTTIQSYMKAGNALLSPHFVYYETLKAENRLGQIGLQPRDAAQTLLNLGVPPESDCPYGDGTLEATEQTPCESSQVMQDASLYKIASYAACTSLADVELTLSKGIPVLLAVPVFSNWENNLDFENTGIVPQPNNQQIGRHGIACCGYDQNKGQLYFENSWGSQWAPNSPVKPGFGVLTEGYLAQFLNSGEASATVLTDVAPTSQG